MRECDWRELSGVQNLVGIGVADATDDAGIGESAFESAVLGGESIAKGFEIAVEDFNAAGVDGVEAVFAAENMERGAAFGAGFGEHERAVREVEGRETITAGKPRVLRAPMQAACDHQVENEPEVAIDPDGDALADAAQSAHSAALEVLERRLHGSKEKRAREADTFEGLVEDTHFERGEVGGDIGEFRHDVVDCRDATKDCNCGAEDKARLARCLQKLSLPAAGTG